MLDYRHIKKLASEAGFDLCGVAPCRHMAPGEARFRDWLARGYHSSLAYMERNAEKRFDPRLLVDGARTAVVCAVSYKNRVGEGYPPDHRTRVASYACAADYHTTIRAMLTRMLDALRKTYPGLEGRAFVDTAPLAEKQLAVEAGLGWIGRQSLLVTPRWGSYVLLGELILTHEADAYDTPYSGPDCGACRACVDNCPTGAITAERTIDTARCISCHTVEKQPQGQIDLGGWIFGCDACQSCCPRNRLAPMHRNAAFDPVFDPLTTDAPAWIAMDDAAFETLCGRTPLVRSGLERIRENVRRNTTGHAANHHTESAANHDSDHAPIPAAEYSAECLTDRVMASGPHCPAQPAMDQTPTSVADRAPNSAPDRTPSSATDQTPNSATDRTADPASVPSAD